MNAKCVTVTFMEIDLVSAMGLLLIFCRKLKLFNTESLYSTLIGEGPCVTQPALRTLWHPHWHEVKSLMLEASLSLFPGGSTR